MGRASQVKAEGGWNTWTTSPASTWKRGGFLYHPQRAERQRQNPHTGLEGAREAPHRHHWSRPGAPVSAAIAKVIPPAMAPAPAATATAPLVIAAEQQQE